LGMLRQTGDRISISYNLINLSRSCLAVGDLENAHQHLQEGLSLSRELGDQGSMINLLVNLSYYYLLSGDRQSSRLHAQQALDLSLENELRTYEAWARHCLGNVDLTEDHFDQSIGQYRTALEIRLEIGEPGEVIDSRAGLAEALALKGEMPAAVEQVEAILTHFQENDVLGLDKPIRVMLVCYRVLDAVRDPRAGAVLEQGHALLVECTANIEDETLRGYFLERVPENRALLQSWQAVFSNP
jgi:tetratricopeptide (TPR) repeat protein